MPIYEYTCHACNKKFDQLVRSMSAEGEVKCPSCGSVKTARALSVFAVGAEGAAKPSAGAAPAGGCCPCGKTPGSCSM